MELVYQMGQCDGVRPTRYRRNHGRIGSEKVITPDRLSNAIQEVHKKRWQA
jgi:hypothetical protein